jgi:Tfp pilus assembly protein FimV
VAYALALATVSVLAVGNSVAGGPIAAATTSPDVSESAAVADALGIDSSGAVTSPMEERELLGQLAASRAQRDAEQAAAAAAQVASEQAAAAARAEAEAKAAAEAAAAAQAASAAAAAAQAEAAGAPSPSVAATAIARISNSGGPVRPQAQAAADAVVSNVPGADGITIGGTRASAADPGGHPSGLALDYMVMSDAALGDAIVEYHIAHWDELGVEYVIWQQRMLSSPGGGWKTMENRGSATANHMDHPHVNYRG